MCIHLIIHLIINVWHVKTCSLQLLPRNLAAIYNELCVLYFELKLRIIFHC